MFGYHAGFKLAKSENATVAWGARAILESDGSFSLLHDRQDWVSIENDTILPYEGSAGAILEISEQLNKGPLKEANAKCKELRKSGELAWDEEKHVILYDKGEYIIAANTNASCGYLYLAAWKSTPPIKVDNEQYNYLYRGGGLKWSADFLPAIGETVRVSMNSFGNGVICGYAKEHGYLFVMVKLDKQPSWHEKQNGKDALCWIMGSEITKVN